MTDELKSIGKEVIVFQSGYYPGIRPKFSGTFQEVIQ
jgi:hypothetical protein